MFTHFWHEICPTPPTKILLCSLRVLAALANREFGLRAVIGGMTVIALLAFAMRRVRGGIAAVIDVRQTYTAKHIQTLLTPSGSF